MRVLVLGYFGFANAKLNGQTVKTRNIYSLLKAHHADTDFFDTQRLKPSPWTALTMLAKFVRARKVFYLPAHGNLKYVFPFLWLLSLLSRTELNYIQIGGWLHEYLQSKPLHVRLLSRISNIFAETELMTRNLERMYGFKNVTVLHNFRDTNLEPAECHEAGALRCVFSARILRMKGIDIIFSMMDEAVRRGARVSVDFYGPVADEDRDYFFENVGRFSAVAYRGELQPADITATLQRYDLMLLPTHYRTEGFPGTVLDAYMAGLPVLVTDWLHAREFVSDGETGYIVPFENGQAEFNVRVFRLLARPSELEAMKRSAYARSRLYTSARAWEILRTKAKIG